MSLGLRCATNFARGGALARARPLAHGSSRFNTRTGAPLARPSRVRLAMPPHDAAPSLRELLDRTNPVACAALACGPSTAMSDLDLCRAVVRGAIGFFDIEDTVRCRQRAVKVRRQSVESILMAGEMSLKTSIGSDAPAAGDLYLHDDLQHLITKFKSSRDHLENYYSMHTKTTLMPSRATASSTAAATTTSATAASTSATSTTSAATPSPAASPPRGTGTESAPTVVSLRDTKSGTWRPKTPRRATEGSSMLNRNQQFLMQRCGGDFAEDDDVVVSVLN